MDDQPEMMSPELELLLEEKIDEILLETNFEKQQELKEKMVARLGVDPALPTVDAWLKQVRSRIRTWKMIGRESCIKQSVIFEVSRSTLPKFSAETEHCRGCLR